MKRPKRKPDGVSVGVSGGNFLTPKEIKRAGEALKKNSGTPIEDPKLSKKEQEDEKKKA